MVFRKHGRRARLGQATLVTREWTPGRGLIERESTLANLAELLESCLDSRVHVPERITLDGTDADGREYSVSFSFASSATRGK